jgi:hypothetical protein
MHTFVSMKGSVCRVCVDVRLSRKGATKRLVVALCELIQERRPAGSRFQACMKRDHAWRAICAQTDAEQPGRWRASIDPELKQ